MTIDLSGPDGNAFALMGIAKNLAKQLEISDINGILDKMMGGDYDNLLEVFEDTFGHVVTLDNKPGEE